MSAYINVNELLKRLPDDLPYKGSVRRVLMQTPPADVVEVVRCKDCVHAWKMNDIAKSIFPKADLLCGVHGDDPVKKDDFCCWGKRCVSDVF